MNTVFAPYFVLLSASREYIVERASVSPHELRPTRPEQVKLRRISDGKEVAMVGQDAEDFLDQLANTTFPADLCADVILLRADRVEQPHPIIKRVRLVRRA